MMAAEAAAAAATDVGSPCPRRSSYLRSKRREQINKLGLLLWSRIKITPSLGETVVCLAEDHV